MLRQISVSILTVFVVGSGRAIAQISPSAKNALPPAVTTVLPASTPGVVLINTTPEVWTDLDRFNPVSNSSFLPLTFPLTFGKMVFTQDIQPWLGDRAAIAVMPATTQDKSFRSSTVLLLPIKDTNRFTAFLDKVKTTWGKPQIERDYKGVTLLRWTAPTPSEEPAEESRPSESPDETPEKPTVPQPKSSPSPSSQLRHRLQPSALVAGERKGKAAKPDSKEPPDLEEQIPPLMPLPPSSELMSRGVTIALLPNIVAIAPYDRALEKLIDARSSEKSTLAENPLFQRTLKHPQFGRSLIMGYGNIAGFTSYLTALLDKVSGLPPAILIPALAESQMALLTKVYNTVDTYLWVQPEGLHGQTNFYFSTPQPQLATPAIPDANQILARLPGITYVSANGYNFKQQWQRFLDTIFPGSTSQQWLNKARAEFRKQTGLDLEKDIVNWMDREYAVFYYPTTGGLFNYISPKVNLGIGFIFQTSDRPTAEATLKKLDQYIRSVSKGEAIVAQRRVKGIPITSWEGKDRGKTQSIFSYGWVSDDTLLITTGVGAMTDLIPKPYLPLNLNPNFKTATTSFPTPNEGYVYVNMGASLSFLYGLILPSVPPEYAPFVQEFQRIIGTIRSVSSSNSTTAEAQRVNSLWVLGSVRKTTEEKDGR
ncbi:DUF3352 domain-containing protein [Leptothermofonsia sp. ETS-13]|uniref:DUF3352 domain-containing protein n=1 Tax=Leptothermofonsia sp. ETS-13 TaxID=3035696 RepID=UPI003B9F0BDE